MYTRTVRVDEGVSQYGSILEKLTPREFLIIRGTVIYIMARHHDRIAGSRLARKLQGQGLGHDICN